VLASLWPDADGDNATHAFDMTLLRLRNQLGEYGRRALRVERSRLVLDSTLCWTDTAALAALLSEITSIEPEVALDCRQRERCAALAERLLDLYRGPFEEEGEAASALSDYAERIRAKVGGAARVLGARLAQAGDLARAESLYVRALEADPLLDTLLAPAISSLLRSGRHAEARALMSARKRRPEPLSARALLEAENALRGA